MLLFAIDTNFCINIMNRFNKTYGIKCFSEINTRTIQFQKKKNLDNPFSFRGSLGSVPCQNYAVISSSGTCDALSVCKVLDIHRKATTTCPG